MTTEPHPLPKVSAVFTDYPKPLIKHLRNVITAASPSDAFACYCHLLEWLASYISNIANSVYLERPLDTLDEKLERSLREAPSELVFGTAVGALRSFAKSSVNFDQPVPQLDEVLHDKVPTTCARLNRAFKLIYGARSDFEIPPRKLTRYLEKNLPDGKALGSSGLIEFLSAIVPFRNKGHGHQAAETWFPRDPTMYTVVCRYLAPAVDDLLTWSPLERLLSLYEVIDVGPALAPQPDSGRKRSVALRNEISDARAPLGTSHVAFNAGLSAPVAARLLARRGELPNELDAVVRYVEFPKTLQSSEHLARRYADTYLDAYLAHGLITRTQREGKLHSQLEELALSANERQRVEGEIQAAINLYSNEDDSAREQSIALLTKLLGPERAAERRETLLSRLEELPTRRKDYIFEQIDNNVLMSFNQLRADSELSEPDLDTVLGELEQEDRVRQLNGAQLDRLHGHFKAQDPSKPERLRALLAELRPKRPEHGYAAPLRRLLDLCAELLSDEGLALDDAELKEFSALFAEESDAKPTTVDTSDAIMTIQIGDEVLRADNLRELFTAVLQAIKARQRDASAAVPMLIGKTRYLVAYTPKHANGTPFAAPIEVDHLFFEGNLRREQALTETLRLLARLGITATSPDVELLLEDELDDELDSDGADPETGGVIDLREDEVDDDDETTTSARLGLGIDLASEEGPLRIEGPTVRRFFAALLDHLIARDAPIAEIVPVATGRVRYLLAEEPYHKNGRRFDSMIERGGYSMNTAYTYDQALSAAALLCDKLDIQATVQDRPPSAVEETTPLSITIGDEKIEAYDVPSFLREVVTALFDRGLLRPDDIPYKSGRVRYLIAETARHDHGRDFIRPVEVEFDGRRYFIEANVSRPGALDLVQRLIASKQASRANEESLSSAQLAGVGPQTDSSGSSAAKLQ